MLFTIYLSILGLLLFLFLWKRKQFKYNYAPGLPVWPVVGSLPHMYSNLTKQSHLQFIIQDWAKKYGNIFSATMGTKPYLFVTGADNVLASLRKEEFQGRPDTVSVRSRSFDKKSMGIFFSDGSLWTENRKFTLRQLKSFGSTQLEQFMTKEVNTLTESLKDGTLMEMTGLFALSAVNVIWLIIANKTFEEDDHEIKLFISDNKRFFRSGNPAGNISDVFPILRYVNKPYQARLNHITDTQNTIKSLIEEHRKILDPNQPFDLIDHYLVEMEKQKNNPNSTLSEEDLIVLCFDLFSAGAEPIVGALDFVLLYLALYPEVQKKMQEEMDTVLGKARTPNLEDRFSLHYAMAVLNEVARINPTAPIAVPHRCTKNTYFNNYYVEKDTTVMIDIWSVGYDPKYWEKPEEFRPERFLNAEGKLKKDHAFAPFGSGQRMCAGEQFSKNITFLFITTFFEKYSIRLPPGEPKPSTIALPGFTTGPQPFKAIIQSRY